MTAILHYLSSRMAVEDRPADRVIACPEPPHDIWPREHDSDLPAARDTDAWIRADLICTGRLA